MKNLVSISIVFLAVLVIYMSGTQSANANEDEGADLVNTEIELERVVHFSGPKGDPVTLDAGRYRVEKRDSKTLELSTGDGASHVIAAAASEHDEAIGDAEALSVAMGNDAHRVLLLHTDGTSWEAVGTYSGVVSRAAVAPLSRTQVNTAYKSRLQTRIESVPTIQPQAYEGGNQVAETWQQKLERQRAGRITSTLLRNAIGKTFSGASLKANACGGSYTYRKTIVNIPNTLYKEEGLQRLHYDLSNGEREKTEWTIDERKLKRDVKGRRYSIRACIDNWQNRDWQGQVVNGLMEVHIPFGDASITTRTIEYWSTTGFHVVGGPRWNWNDSAARNAIQDRNLSPVLIVTLRPKYSNGKITYQANDAKWDLRMNMWSRYGRFRLSPAEPDKIYSYMNSNLEILRGRYLAIFNNQNVRARLSEDLTDSLLANNYVNRITGIDEANSGGTVITVSYD